MSSTSLTTDSLQQELIRRVSALEGKQCVIDDNRKTLRATVEALNECTSIDPQVIQTIANQLSVQAKFVEPVIANSNAELKDAKNTRIAKYCAIAMAILFAWSMLKWLNVNNSIKAVSHEVSSLQSKMADFQLRTGRYPHSFEQIGLTTGTPELSKEIKSIEIGPQGQLLIATNGFFESKMLLTPEAGAQGWPRWTCNTNASWLFSISSWLCSYESSLYFKQ